MGKRHDTSTEDDNTAVATTTVLNEHSPPKKHKKRKHKKHKKKRIHVEESDDTQDINVVDDAAALKIKLKLAKETAGPSTSAEKIKDSQKEPLPKPGEKITSVSSSPKTAGVTSAKKKRNRGKDSGTSSEEERWLDAIESGKLEEVDDELKKIKPKDPKLMTARQRAMFERKSDKEPTFAGEQLVALPSGYKEKVMTVEALQKAALKSQKRKQQADEKREKDKKKTMERLLRKQDSKSGKANKSRATRKSIPRVTYRSNALGVSISMPLGVDFPLSSKAAPPAVKAAGVARCGVQGCTNPRRYACSKTGVSLCSLECYRINAKLAGT